MDLCVVDCGIIKDILIALIGAGIPSFVAWRIFKNWRGQKAKEVLALKAQEVYFELNKIIVALDNFDKQIEVNPGTTTTQSKAYIELKESNKGVMQELTLLKDLLEEENSPYSKDFKDSYNEFNSFDNRLEWINMWRIRTGDTNPLVARFEHFQKIRDSLKIQDTYTEIKNIKSKLAKIILHK